MHTNYNVFDKLNFNAAKDESSNYHKLNHRPQRKPPVSSYQKYFNGLFPYDKQ